MFLLGQSICASGLIPHLLLRSARWVSLEAEVLRAVEDSLASRGRPAHLDHGACRGIGVHLESEGLRVLRYVQEKKE